MIDLGEIPQSSHYDDLRTFQFWQLLVSLFRGFLGDGPKSYIIRGGVRKWRTRPIES